MLSSISFSQPVQEDQIKEEKRSHVHRRQEIPGCQASEAPSRGEGTLQSCRSKDEERREGDEAGRSEKEGKEKEVRSRRRLLL